MANQQPYSGQVAWTDDQVRAFGAMIREQDAHDPAGMARFEWDNDWYVRSSALDPSDHSVVVVELVDEAGRMVMLRCLAHTVSADSPYKSVVDLYSVRLHEFAGAIGLNRLDDGDVVEDVALLYEARITGPSRPKGGVRVRDLPEA
jgi:hypothetical protein